MSDAIPTVGRMQVMSEPARVLITVKASPPTVYVRAECCGRCDRASDSARLERPGLREGESV